MAVQELFERAVFLQVGIVLQQRRVFPHVAVDLGMAVEKTVERFELRLFVLATPIRALAFHERLRVLLISSRTPDGCARKASSSGCPFM
jgi:hypothetical protein